MIVEDKILEYLDGSLGESESAELLETLSVNPEKRALLEEHLRLKDLLTLGRKPFSVPIETERELARRIPILGRYNDNLAPTRWALSGVRRFIGAKAIGLALGAGAMIALAGLGWYSTHQPTTSLNGNSINGNSINGNKMANISNVTDVSHPTSLQFSSATTNFSAPTAHTISGDAQSGAGSLSHNHSLLPIPSNSAIAEQAADQTPDLTPVITLRESAAAIPITEESIPHTMQEIRIGPPDQLSPMTIGTSIILDESYLPTLSTEPQHRLQNLLEDVTFDYDLSPNFAIGIELGDGMSSSLSNTPLTNESTNYTRVVNNVVVANQMIYDAMLAFHYTLFPESEYQLRLGADGGTAFGTGPMAEATAGISRVLAPNLLLDVTAIASRVWTSGSAPASSASTNGVVGIVGSQVPQQSMYTTGFGIRAGLRIRL